MAELGIALDLGTSGFRGQAVDLTSGAVFATAVTTRHPLPGANVIDHLHVALELSATWAHDVVVEAVDQVIDHLGVDRTDVARLAVCGNPIQLSLFEDIEIRDLAYAGKRKLEALAVESPDRDARIVTAEHICGLRIPSSASVILPPAVHHEIGADALAMMVQTGMLERDEIALVTDYGTNAEMALVVDGTVYTGSTAAGPALEGQQISDGLLALPGAITDVECLAGDDWGRDNRHLATWVLDREMTPRPGDLVDPTTGRMLDAGQLKAVGITGTGVIALLAEGMRERLIRIPRIDTYDTQIHLPNGLRFTEEDLLEAGKAIGSIRAGHLTLCHEAGIRLEDIEIAFMSGASGTYVDARKAREVGLIPGGARRVFQVGNTSLAMARDLVREPETVWRMQELAHSLRRHHCMFAASKVFEKVYILELSHWTEGMPLEQYRRLLERYGFPDLPVGPFAPLEVVKTVERDIQDLGARGLTIVPEVGRKTMARFHGCLGDGQCVVECPEQALRLTGRGAEFLLEVDLSRCGGIACRRCERVCSEKILNWVDLVQADDEQETACRPAEAD